MLIWRMLQWFGCPLGTSWTVLKFGKGIFVPELSAASLSPLS